MNKEQLNAMRQAEVTQVPPALLADIHAINVETALPAEQRLERYLEQVRNPYCFRCGNTPVRVRFAARQTTLAQALEHYFTHLRE